MSPKDYPEPQQVRDYIAENGIKWGVVAQGLILAAIISVCGIGVSFGGRVIDGIEKINDTLTDVRKEISLLNTGVGINASRIDNLDSVTGRHESEISENRKIIRTYLSRE